MLLASSSCSQRDEDNPKKRQSMWHPHLREWSYCTTNSFPLGRNDAGQLSVWNCPLPMADMDSVAQAQAGFLLCRAYFCSSCMSLCADSNACCRQFVWRGAAQEGAWLSHSNKWKQRVSSWMARRIRRLLGELYSMRLTPYDLLDKFGEQCELHMFFRVYQRLAKWLQHELQVASTVSLMNSLKRTSQFSKEGFINLRCWSWKSVRYLTWRR